jgi:hypothetical protein
MSLVLAIEPDAQQAEAVRQIVRERIGAELVLVNSTDAAVAAINRRVPDLVLLGAAISDKGQTTVIKHLRSLTQATGHQALVIPPLQQDEPAGDLRPGLRRKRQPPRSKQAEFADLIGSALAQGRKAQRGLEALLRPRERQDEALKVELGRAAEPAGVEPSTLPAETLGAVPDQTSTDGRGPTDEDSHPTASEEDYVTVELESLVEPLTPDASSSDAELEGGTSAVESRIHAAQIALIQADAAATLADELERVRSDATDERLTQLANLRAEAEALRDTAVREARAAAEAEAGDRFAAQLAQVRSDADNALAETVLRIRSEAAQTLEVELARVREDVEGNLRAELERVRAAADEARLAEHQARLETVRRAADIALVRTDTEAALAAEGERAREETAREHRLEIARLQAEADTLRDLALSEPMAEIARIKADAETALAAEVDRVRDEAARERRAQIARLREEADAHRHAAVAEARAAADASAREAVAVELANVRAEADATLAATVQRLRSEAAHALAAELSQARAETEQVTRQLGRVETDAETRLRTVVEHVRHEAERARRAEQSEAALEGERRLSEAIGHVRAEVEHAGARALATEVARMAAETAGLRTQTDLQRAVDVLGIRDRVALAETVTVHAPEERRHSGPGAPMTPTEPARAPERRSRSPWPRVSPRALSAAAAVVLVVGGGVFVDVRALVRSAGDASAAWLGGASIPGDSATPAPTNAPVAPRVGALRIESTPGARVMVDGRDRGLSPLTLTDLRPGRHALVLQNDNGTVRRTVTIRAGEQAIATDQIISGFLTVFSRIQLDIYLADQRIGTTEDGQLLVAPGRHTFTLVNERFNYRTTVVLDVKPGAATPHTVSLPTGSLRVTTTPGAEVWIDGARVGAAPLGELAVQIGSRDVLVKSPELGERRQVVEVRYGQPTEVTLPLERTVSDAQ